MIAVVDYRKGNLKSVERGLIAAGGDARITDDARIIAAADAIVLPGVGAFADAAASMEELGQMDVVRERVRAGVPFLGICLGLHLMFEGGAEGAPTDANGALQPVAGLGLAPGMVRALPRTDAAGNKYKIPHVGWNNVDFVCECPLFAGVRSGEFFYFTHSYAVPESRFTVATTTHSITFPSAVQVGPCAFGVQFHPEKSSDAGAVVLRNFVRVCERESGIER